MAKDTKWSALRKAILEQRPDGCESCGETGVRVNIHHRYYEAGKKKWNYPVESFEVLCNKCHGQADERRRKLARSSGKLDLNNTDRAMGYMEALALLDDGVGQITIRSHSQSSGVADLFGVSDFEILRHLDRLGRISFDKLVELSGLPVHMIHRGGAEGSR